MKENKINFTMRIEKEEKVQLEQYAEKLGMNVSDLIRVGARFYGSFSPWFVERVKELGARGDISESVMVELMVLEYLADREAFFKKTGKEDKPLFVVTRGRSGVVKGKQYYSDRLRAKMEG